MQRILIVDDDRSATSAIKRAAGNRYDVMAACNGATALSALSDFSDIRAIVCDIRMHGLNGIEVLERSNRIAPNTVRIMLTKHIDMEVLTAAVNRAAVHRILSKPIKPERLLDAVEECIRHEGASAPLPFETEDVTTDPAKPTSIAA